MSIPNTAVASSLEISSVITDKNGKGDKIHWGIVGLGDVTKVKSGPPFWKCTGSQLVAVMRRTPGKAHEFATTVVPSDQECVGYDNLDAFLQHDGLDAVYVATRPGTHLEVCQQVAAAGKACYVEKPVGRCAAETQAIVDCFERANLPLYTAYISRAYDRTQLLKQELLSSVFGSEGLASVSYSLIGTGGARDMDGPLPWRLDAKQSGGGLLMDVGCHVVDRIDYLCGGPLTNVHGEAANRNSPQQPVEDYVHVSATIGGDGPHRGATVTCTWDFAGNEERDDLVLVGRNGRTIRLAGMNPAGPIQVMDTDGTLQKEFEFTKPEHTAQQLIQAVTNDLLIHEHGTKTSSYALPDLLSFGDNAIRTQQVLDACLSSYYGGREIGYWKRSDSWPGRPT